MINPWGFPQGKQNFPILTATLVIGYADYEYDIVNKNVNDINICCCL